MDLSNDTLRAYLLGQLSEDEEIAVDERLWSQPELAEQADATLAELFDACARSELSLEDKKAFTQRHLQDAAGKERLASARALAAHADAQVTAAPGLLARLWRSMTTPTGMALGGGLALACALLLIVLRPGPMDSADRVELRPIGLRGVEDAVQIVSSAKRVRLALRIPPDEPSWRSYHLVLRSAGPSGEPIEHDLGAATLVDGQLHGEIPGDLLTTGSHELELRARNTDEEAWTVLAYYRLAKAAP